LRELGVELVPGDLDDRAALDRLLAQGGGGAPVDGLFHVAGWYKLGDPDPSMGERVNVDGTRNVLEAARRAGTPRIVHTSTLAVNSDTRGRVLDEEAIFRGTHISTYDRTKAEAHRIAKEFAKEGLPVVIAMPGGIYGPGDTSQTGALMRQVVEGKRPPAPRGGGTLMWAHVSDVAAGHVLAMERGFVGESYMLAGDPATLAELLQLTAKVAGTPGPLLVPRTAIRLGERVSRVLERFLTLPNTYHPETMRAALASYVGTRRKAERELGWHARPLEDGLIDTVEALRREQPRR
jgi:dihydroflavonol-4-reductase